MLENTLTKAEQSLVNSGREQLVLDTRRAYQSTMRNDLVGAVEELTRRTVIAFMSDNHIDPDVATETFLLAPPAVESVVADDPGPTAVNGSAPS